MYRRFALIVFILIQGLTYSQTEYNTRNEDKRLLYYFQEPGFLVPYIETELKQMIDISVINRQENKYFSDIESLNRLKQDLNLQGEMTNLVWSQINANSIINLELSDSKLSTEIIRTILDYNYFLSIKTNTLGELIEFQFELFKTEPIVTEDKKGNIRNGTLKKVNKVQNFFINPSEKGYLNEIKNALYKLFENNNDIPKAIIKFYNETYTKNFEAFVSVGDTINISGLRSYDIDTEKLNYHWKNIPEKNQYYQHINKVDLKTNEPVQSIVIINDSILNLRFIVDDGINESDPIDIRLIPLPKPKNLLIDFKEYVHYDYLTGADSETNIGTEAEVYLNEELESKDDRIIISSYRLHQKYQPKENEKDTIDYYKGSNIYNKNTVFFKTNFNETENGILKKKQKKKYFLYRMNKKNLLSNPVLFEHKYVKRGGVTFRTGFSSSWINEGGYMNQITSDSIQYSTSTILLEMGIDLSKRFRLFGYFDLIGTNNINIDGYNFSPQPEIGGGLEYYFIKRYNLPHSRVSPFIGVEFGGTSFVTDYRIENPAPEWDESSSNFIYTYGLRAGITTHFESRWFLFQPGMLLKIGKYNRSFLSDYNFSTMCFTLGFKF